MKNKKKMLVVIDMQNDFVTGALGTKEAREIVPVVKQKIADAVEDPDTFVVFTKDTHDENYKDTLEGIKLPVEHCIKGTDGWEIIPELKELVGNGRSLVLHKNTFGNISWAFYDLDSLTHLKDPNESVNPTGDFEIEICGLCTDICVVTNALILRTRYPNTKIVVDRNATAGVTPESKEAALLTMKMCQIDIVG